MRAELRHRAPLDGSEKNPRAPGMNELNRAHHPLEAQTLGGGTALTGSSFLPFLGFLPPSVSESLPTTFSTMVSTRTVAPLGSLGLSGSMPIAYRSKVHQIQG